MAIPSNRKQNWENFCKYHAKGDWYGNWNFYSAQGELLRTFKAIRSLVLNEAQTSIEHQNTYFYEDGRIEKEVFGPHTPQTAKAMYIENSFSLGTERIEEKKVFFLEIGFSHATQRASAVVTYNENGEIANILTIREVLGYFPENFHNEDEYNPNFLDCIALKMNAERKIVTAPYSELLQSCSDSSYKMFNLFVNSVEEIRVNCPLTLNISKNNYFEVQWRYNNSLNYQGTRFFELENLKIFEFKINVG